jgi:hypothetical protein
VGRKRVGCAVGRGLEDLTLAPQGQRLTTRARALISYVGAMGPFASVYQYLLTHSNDPFSAVQFPGEEKEAIRIVSLLRQAGGDPIK